MLEMSGLMGSRRTTNRRDYNPARLVDGVVAHLRLKNDADLARTLAVHPPVISKIRNKHMGIGATILLRMHDVSQITIAELPSMYGERRAGLRMGSHKRLERHD